MYHRPVLLEESLNGLNIQPGGTYVDFTFGGGGHSAGILDRLGGGRLVAFDQDPDTESNLMKDERLLFIRGNFRYARNFLRFHEITSIHGALADLGVSSHHFDAPERGFSFRQDAPIDMRMNPESGLTAAGVLNSYDEQELVQIFRKYGEVENAGRLSAAVCAYRSRKKISTTGEFLEAVSECIPQRNRQKYLARVFQSLRIEVNAEMDALKEMLTGIIPFLNRGGRMVIITYHSLEDRLVKNFFRSGNAEGLVEKDFYGHPITPLRPVNRNVIRAGEDEIRINPRARSAKLRIAEKTAKELT
jgi:16S rRNA (cytosine1402-N4)-methyltransferase